MKVARDFRTARPKGAGHFESEGNQRILQAAAAAKEAARPSLKVVAGLSEWRSFASVVSSSSKSVPINPSNARTRGGSRSEARHILENDRRPSRHRSTSR